MPKIVVLKLSPELLKSVDTPKKPSGPGNRKSRGSVEHTSSPAPGTIPALNLAPPTPTASGNNSNTNTSSGGPIGGGGAKSMAAVNASLRQLDKTGTPCRKWTKASINLKSFTGVQYTLQAWKGADESPLMELELAREREKEKEKEERNDRNDKDDKEKKDENEKEKNDEKLKKSLDGSNNLDSGTATPRALNGLDLVDSEVPSSRPSSSPALEMTPDIPNDPSESIKLEDR